MQETLTYRERGKRFLVKAQQEFAEGDLEQASEKAWGASALMVKAAAEKRGVALRQHAFLFRLVETLASETGDRELDALFDRANALHSNFYEHRLDNHSVQVRIRQ